METLPGVQKYGSAYHKHQAEFAILVIWYFFRGVAKVCVPCFFPLQNEIQLETQKGEIKKGGLHAEAEVKKALMDHEFELNMKMKQMELDMIKERETTKEVMKDNKETRNQDTKNRHESRMEDKKTANAMKTKGFESSGNDVIGEGMRLGAFDPK